MSKPILLDLFCGAGGCAKGYQQAGFYVVGVDINPQPRYAGDEFYQADALEFVAQRGREFDVIHASPPCQAFSLATCYHGNQEEHADLITPTREMLDATGRPYVVENVPGAPVRRDLLLCGEMFGLQLHRHRLFETGEWLAFSLQHPRHRLRSAAHNCHVAEGHTRLVAGHFADLASASQAMGIDWMTRAELSQAIPPAYTEFIGRQLLAHVGSSN
jgi:DNA (cytosine-5)-methyltransferase 1